MQALREFFDANWYVGHYRDVAQAGADPFDHFVNFGLEEGRNPNAWFDGQWYERSYSDVKISKIHPLLHYLRYGAGELRNPHPQFDAVWYVDQHPEARPNPLLYHLQVGLARNYETRPRLKIEDYLPSTVAPHAGPKEIAIDVIIPVYRGVEQTKKCINSVLQDNERHPGMNIVVVDDCAPDEELTAWLEELALSGSIALIKNPQNLGFVKSVNIGIAHGPDRDVVLLNSDTEVPSNWLQRLSGHAYSHPKIGSVSPFSNNATICSYPSDQGGTIPFGCDLPTIDALCRKANSGRSVFVPTTVGFCMYIRRATLDEVGAFDAEAFGRGYGEENDFCLRASRLGWKHLLACDVFVYHEGSVSFGAEMGPLAKEGLQILRSRYPDYEADIARYVRRDPVGPNRFTLTAAIFAQSALPTILLVSHSLGGGVQRQVEMVVRSLEGRANFLLLRGGADGATLSVPSVEGHPHIRFRATELGLLVRFLRCVGVARVHIHHLASVEFDIRSLVVQLGVPFDFTVHDYYVLCPQVNFLPAPDGFSCVSPTLADCNECISIRPSYQATDILGWRLTFDWLLQEADRIICPSDDAKARISAHHNADTVIVAPHEPVIESEWRVRRRRRPNKSLRIAILGVLANHKGAYTVAEFLSVRPGTR